MRLFLQSDSALGSSDYSSYNTGTGSFEILTKTVTTEAAGDRLLFGIEIDSAGSVDIDACMLVEGEVAPQRFVHALEVLTSVKFGVDGEVVTDGGPNGDGSNLQRHPFHKPAIISYCQLTAETAPTGASVDVDLLQNGNSMYTSTFPSIAIAGTAGGLAPNGTYQYRCMNGGAGATLANNELQWSITQKGSTLPGEYLDCLVRILQWQRPFDYLADPEDMP